jgi:NRPS condensation-like uncharacterized protein
MTEQPLFPLPISPFEYYMISDERPGYPMTIPMRFELKGRIDRDAFEAALHETVDIHPLLKAVIRKVRRLGLSWHLLEDWKTPIEWNSGEPKLELDIRKQPGLRVWVREQNEGSQVICVFHHACVDGIAVVQFVGDWLAAYARRTASDAHPAPRLKPLDPELLRQRSHFPVELPEPIGLGTLVRESLREAFRWLTRPASPLASPQDASPMEQRDDSFESLGFIWADLAAADVQRYREIASSLDVTLNDLLIRDMFLTVKKWNHAHQSGRSGRWLRITMPTSLRMRTHRKMPVANVISYAFLTRTDEDCNDVEDLLSGVHEETKFIRDWHVSLMFLNSISIGRRIPLLTWWMSRNERRCYSTTNLSYLGEFPRLFRARFPKTPEGKIIAGNLTLENLYGAPPVRPQTHATLALMSYLGDLGFCMRVNQTVLPMSAARDLLNAYLAQIEETITSGK